jgi:hypothetical protein
MTRHFIPNSRLQRPGGPIAPPHSGRSLNELLAIQATYANWLAALPDGLRGSSIAEVLEAMVELDLTDLVEIELPRGYGRD